MPQEKAQKQAAHDQTKLLTDVYLHVSLGNEAKVQDKAAELCNGPPRPLNYSIFLVVLLDMTKSFMTNIHQTSCA